MVSSVVSFVLRPLLRYWGRKAKPQTRGEIQIPGLEKTVRVLWGPHAVPHIFAASERDLFLAQGYVHAQERLWQMDLSRLSLSGRLAETFGMGGIPWRELSAYFKNKNLADLDYFTRLMGLRRAACESVRLLPEEFLEPLTAYSEGVNRYIETHLQRLPIEFRLLRYEPEPWRPEDSLTIGKGFAFFLSTSLMTRMTLTAIRERLKGQEAKLKSLFPSYPESAPSITRPAPGTAEELIH
ncbi:MAG: penicillin acylase family protein, partial [Deltaproteobacteria bacterium]|nr:penicillin acylase family protein [Deltaproteobacteria bacterium]